MAYQNFFVTKLSTAIGAADTVITLDTVPTVTSGYLVIDPKNASTREIIRFTGVAGSTITGVTRGQTPTSATPHTSGAIVQMNVTAQDLTDALNVNSNVTNYFNDLFGDGVALTGTVWTISSGLTGQMTTGYVYINGQRIQAPAIASKLFPASKDTYVDFDTNGAPIYNSVDPGVGEPTQAADTVRASKVTTSGAAITAIDNLGVRQRLVIPQSIDGDRDYVDLPTVPNTIVHNGNRSYTMTFVGANYTGLVNPGSRIRTARTVAAPTQSTSLNGTNQYWNNTSPTKLTFTDDFVVSAWVKLDKYATTDMNIISRFNGTNGWRFTIQGSPSGLVIDLTGFNAGAGNFSQVRSYQTIPAGKWVHISAQLDMSSFSVSPTTSWIMIDGADIAATVNRGGTNPTSLGQAGSLEVGSINGGTAVFGGKIAQVAVFGAKVTQATMQGYMSQGLVGNEPSLLVAYSFNGNANDLNTTTPHNLTAQNSVNATNADSPFGVQASGLVNSSLDYGIVQSATFSTNTTIVVQAPEGNAIPTTGGLSAISYSSVKAPYGFPAQADKFTIQLIEANEYAFNSNNNMNTNVLYQSDQKIICPIGAWNANHYAVLWQGNAGGAAIAAPGVVIGESSTIVYVDSSAKTYLSTNASDFMYSYSVNFSINTSTQKTLYWFAAAEGGNGVRVKLRNGYGVGNAVMVNTFGIKLTNAYV